MIWIFVLWFENCLQLLIKIKENNCVLWGSYSLEKCCKPLDQSMFVRLTLVWFTSKTFDLHPYEIIEYTLFYINYIHFFTQHVLYCFTYNKYRTAFQVVVLQLCAFTISTTSASVGISTTHMKMLNWTGAGVAIGVLIPALTPPPPSLIALSMFQEDGMRKGDPVSQPVFICVCYYALIKQRGWVFTLWEVNQMNNVDQCIGKILPQYGYVYAC